MAAGNGRRILVVDDEELMRQFYVRLLASRGYTIVTADQGLQAMDILNSQPPFDLAIVDLVMPVCNGWQLIEKIRSSPHAKMPILAVTGLSNSAEELKVVFQKCEGVLMKSSFDMAIFLKAIEKLVDLGVSRRQPPEPEQTSQAS